MKKYPFYEVEASIYYSGKFIDLEYGVSYVEWFQQHNITIGRKPLFNPFLAFVLTEENIPAIRYDADGTTKRGLNLHNHVVIPRVRQEGDGMIRGEFTLDAEFNQSYVDGYFRGEKDFHLMALHNSKVYLTEQYERVWSVYESKIPLRISHEVVEEYGYYAAHIAGVQNLGLIKTNGSRSLTGLQYAALLWYNGIKTLTSSDEYKEIEDLKAEDKYPYTTTSGKTIYRHHSYWENQNTRYGKGLTKKSRAEIAKVYLVLEDFDLKDREEYYKDRQAFRETDPIDKKKV